MFEFSTISPGQTPPVIGWCALSFVGCIFNILALIFKILYYLAFFLAVIFIVWGGITFITGGGSADRIKKAKQILIWAGIGLVVAILAYAFVILITRFLVRPQISLELFQTVLAQTLPETPKYLKCGPFRVPSVFERTPSGSNFLERCLTYYLTFVLSWLYRISLAFSVIMLIWAGINYITKPEKAKETHKMIIYALVGAVVTVLAWTIVRVIETTLTSTQ